METQFQVNHLGHWLLTQMLMPLLEKTAEVSLESSVEGAFARS